VLKQEGRVTYFVGPDSYFWHPETDAAGPRFARATLIAPGPVRAREGAVSGLGIAHRTLRHWTRPLDEQCPGSFHAPRPGRGGATRMKRASRSTGWSAGDAWIPGREIRRLTPTGHPTALLTPARHWHSPLVAGRRFSRWCQENSFGYRRQPDDLDGLVP